jgi:hypothetical protein
MSKTKRTGHLSSYMVYMLVQGGRLFVCLTYVVGLGLRIALQNIQLCATYLQPSRELEYIYAQMVCLTCTMNATCYLIHLLPTLFDFHEYLKFNRYLFNVCSC